MVCESGLVGDFGHRLSGRSQKGEGPAQPDMAEIFAESAPEQMTKAARDVHRVDSGNLRSNGEIQGLAIAVMHKLEDFVEPRRPSGTISKARVKAQQIQRNVVRRFNTAIEVTA